MSDDGWDSIHQQDWVSGYDDQGDPCYDWSASDIPQEYDPNVDEWTDDDRMVPLKRRIYLS